MTTTDMPTQSQTSLFESVRISVEPTVLQARRRRCWRRRRRVWYQIADCQRTDRQHGNGSIAFDPGILVGTVQDHCTDHRDRHYQQHVVAEPSTVAMASAPMPRETSPDDGKPFQHQRNSQQGGTQSDQYPCDETCRNIL